MQFSLKRLMLGVALVAILAGLARVLPISVSGWAVFSAATGVLAVGFVVLVTDGWRFRPAMTFAATATGGRSCDLLITTPLFTLGVVCGVGAPFAAVMSVLAMFGI